MKDIWTGRDWRPGGQLGSYSGKRCVCWEVARGEYGDKMYRTHSAAGCRGERKRRGKMVATFLVSPNHFPDHPQVPYETGLMSHLKQKKPRLARPTLSLLKRAYGKRCNDMIH